MLAELPHGKAAVRDPVLLVCRELGHRAAVPGDHEDRVVAEALLAARGQPDLTADLAVEELDATIRPCERRDADEAGATLLDAVEQGQQLLVALGRGRIVAEEAAAAQTRGAAERVDLETRIVRDGPQTARGSVRASLVRRVRREGRARFLRLARNGNEVGRYHQIEVEAGEELSIFA